MNNEPPGQPVGLGDAATHADGTKEDLANAYARGYYAGERRKKKAISADTKRRHEDAMWHRYMAAALTACVNANGWSAGDNPKIVINTLPERANLAADFADEAVKLARQRSRL